MPRELEISPPATSLVEPAVELGSLQDRKHDSGNEIESVTVETSIQYPSGKRLYLILFSATLTLITGRIDSSIVAVAVPSITNHFHTVSDVGWYSAAYRLCLCSFQFMFGKLYRLYPLKTLFLTSIAILLIGAVVCATAPSSAAFVIGRAISGFANAGIVAGCYATLASSLPLRRRPMYTGVLGCLEGLAGISSPIIGGTLVENLGWRWCFWIILPLAGLTFICLIFCLPNVENDKNLTIRQVISNIDLLGNSLFVLALTCLFLALSWAGTKYPWHSAVIIGLLAVFPVLLALFAWDQWLKADLAILPPRILRNRSVLAGFAFSFCCNSAMTVIEYYLPTYFQVVHDFSPTKSGYLMIPTMLGLISGLLAQGFGVSVSGYFTQFMITGSILMPVFAGLLTTLTVESNLARILLYAGFYGFAVGIGFQSPQIAVQASLPDTDANLGLAVILFAPQFGPAVFISAAQSILGSRLAHNLSGLAPGLNATSIQAMGLTELRDQVEAKDLPRLLQGFNLSMTQTWYLAVGLACLTTIGSVMRVKQPRPHTMPSLVVLASSSTDLKFSQFSVRPQVFGVVNSRNTHQTRPSNVEPSLNSRFPVYYSSIADPAPIGIHAYFDQNPQLSLCRGS
ncbi:permease of the major facilitator superfamily [Dactylonectria estremocensis]|uniref:Permease of the major facilitator superfamily n=1 Tax=Dactylonectria estremocensis TaxID=1079267 RepID=A0A9P9EPN7_9HYPO|nr:permease of the major facilitator superfamily [Dactylonectria estremocensis]